MTLRNLARDVNPSVTNEQFLQAIFGDEWKRAHVTGFPDDPTNIEQNRRGLCWGGGFAGTRLRHCRDDTNNFFTISTFNEERRSKAVFKACYVIVADDVREKLPIEEVEKLPDPSYRLETSQGSEQWGWILEYPEEDRGRVENLLDGLVAKGLAPDGKDPGMKGVTRYVRMPVGVNTKASKLVDGEPFECRLISWNPGIEVRMEDLAEPFGIDLDAEVSENTNEYVDETGVLAHPIFQRGFLDPDGTGSEGFVRIERCVNAEEHSGGDPSGAAVRVTDDGRLQYSCHHGHCENITGRDAIRMIDEREGRNGEFIRECRQWEAEQAFEAFDEGGDVVSGNSDEIVKGSTDLGDMVKRYVWLLNEAKWFDLFNNTVISKDSLDTMYRHVYSGGRNNPPLASIAISTHPNKRVADGVGFHPGKPRLYDSAGRKKYANMWNGISAERIEGKPTLWIELMKYIYGDYVDHVIGHMAYTLQKPDQKIRWQIMTCGVPRTGKTLSVKVLGHILGDHFGEISSKDHGSQFDDDFIGRKVVVYEEIMQTEGRQFYNNMKSKLANDYVELLNPKSRGKIAQKNVYSIYMFSNHFDALPVDVDDDKLLVLFSDAKPRDLAYYDKVAAYIDSPVGIGQIYNYLMAYDLSNFSSDRLPVRTKWVEELARNTRPDYEKALEDAIDACVFPFDGDWITMDVIRKWVKNENLAAGQKGIARALRNLGFEQYQGQRKIDGVKKSSPRIWTRVDLGTHNVGEIYDFWTGELEISAKDETTEDDLLS